MKHLALIIVAMLLPIVAAAQKQPGTTTIYPRLGVNWSKFTNDKIYVADNNSVGTHYIAGFTGGVEVQHQFSNVIAASIGALYSRQGTKYGYIEDFGELEVHTDNLLVPVLLVATSNIGLDFKLGLQPEFKLGGNNDWGDQLHSFNLSLPVGVAYEWHNVALDVRYNIGLTNLYKGEDMYDTSHGSTFQITLGYAFDL